MNTEWSKPTKYIVGIALALLGIYILYLSRPVIPLLTIAALIAVIVRPAILWLHNELRLPRGLAVAVVYLGLAILAPLGLLLVIPTIVDAVSYVVSLDYQSILQGSVEWMRSTLAAVKAAQLPVASLDTYVDQAVDALLSALETTEPAATGEPPSVETILRSLGTALTATLGAATGLVGAVFSQIALLIFMFLASIYISLGAHTYRGALLRTVPPAYQAEISILLARIERLWNAFFRGQLTLMLVIGVMCWLGLSVLGVPGALYLGIIAGLLEIIPNLGPIIATVPAVIVALLQGSSSLQVSPLILAGLVILFYVLVQQLENNVIVPRVIGEAVELPPLIVITGVIVGTSVGGVLGALLATPIVATGREILRYSYRKMQGEEPFLIGEEAALQPGARPSRDLLQPVRDWLRQLARSRMPAARPPAPPQPEPDASPSLKSETEAEDYPQNK